jgi:endonuclease YncB( thermonuclease family)
LYLWAFVIAAVPNIGDATNGCFKAETGCSVWRVIDGDTLSMWCADGFVRLRLAQIDTP